MVKKSVFAVHSIIIFVTLSFSMSNIALAQEDNIHPEQFKEERLEAIVNKVLVEREIIPEYGQDEQLYQKLELFITSSNDYR